MRFKAFATIKNFAHAIERTPEPDRSRYCYWSDVWNFVLVMDVAQVGALKLRVQARVVKLGWSSWGDLVGVFRSGVLNSWLPSFDGVSLHTTSR
jgi:hypothetical protein